MSYDFSFDKKSAILIAIGCIAIGILLFFAGYIVGLDKGQSQASSLAPAHQEANSTAAKEIPVSAKPSAARQEPNPAAASEKPASEPGKEPTAPVAEKPDAKTPDPKSPDAKNDPKNGDPKDKDKDQFSLQLGAFQTEDNALKLRDTLKSKGYPVFLFRVLDPNGHLWHTVRMGHYGDMKEASQAAARMTGKEEISAWVRPSNAF